MSEERFGELQGGALNPQLVNGVKKIANIEFLDKTSILINDKGAPVFNQVTSFNQAKS